jgi:hypothetical protein
VPSSRSQSSQSVQNTTQQFDERVAATDSAIVLQQKDGSQLTFNVTDDEAVELALSFAGDVAAQSVKFAASESAASRERGAPDFIRGGSGDPGRGRARRRRLCRARHHQGIEVTP